MKSVFILLTLFVSMTVTSVKAQDVQVENTTDCDLVVRVISYDNSCNMDHLSLWTSVPAGQTVIITNPSSHPFSVAYVAEYLGQPTNCFDPVLIPSWNSCHGGPPIVTAQSCCRNLVLTAKFVGPQISPTIYISQ